MIGTSYKSTTIDCISHFIHDFIPMSTETTNLARKYKHKNTLTNTYTPSWIIADPMSKYTTQMLHYNNVWSHGLHYVQNVTGILKRFINWKLH